MDVNETGVATFNEYWDWVQKQLKAKGAKQDVINKAKKHYQKIFNKVANGNWYINDAAYIAYIKKTVSRDN